MKWALQSKTILGAIAALVAFLLQRFVDVTEAEVLEWLTLVVAVVSFVVTVVGRWKARRTITMSLHKAREA